MALEAINGTEKRAGKMLIIGYRGCLRCGKADNPDNQETCGGCGTPL